MAENNFLINEATLAGLKDKPDTIDTFLKQKMKEFFDKKTSINSRKRTAEGQQKGVILVNGKAYKSVEAAMIALTSSVPQGTSAERLLAVAMNAITFVMSDQGQAGMTSLQTGVLNKLKEMGQFSGTRAKGEKAVLQSQQNRELEAKFNTKSIPFPVSGLANLSENDIVNLIISHIQEKASAYTGGDFFNLKESNLFPFSKDIEGQERARIGAFERTRSPILFAVSDPTDDTAPSYIIEQKFNINTVVDQGQQKIGEVKKFNQQITKLNIAQTKITQTVTDEGLKKFIDELIALTPEGQRPFEYGHIVSIQAVLLEELKNAIGMALRGLKNLKLNSTYLMPMSNLYRALHSFTMVAKKLDSMIMDILNGFEIPTKSDMVEALKTTNLFEQLDINKTTVVVMDNGLKVKAGSSMSKKMQIQVASGVTENVVPHAKVETRKFNAAKGALVAAVLRILEENIEEILRDGMTQQRIMELLVEKMGSDSLLSGSLKGIFGQTRKIKKGSKTKKKSTAVKAQKSTSRNRNPKRVSRIAPKVSKGTEGRTNNISKVTTIELTKQAGGLKDMQDLLPRLNTIITEKVAEQMTSETLQYRTGRFANSVEITAIIGGSIVFNYMRNPYDVFSKDKGRQPWNSRIQRDPSYIINQAIASGLRSLGEPAYPSRKA